MERAVRALLSVMPSYPVASLNVGIAVRVLLSVVSSGIEH
jgi:hypothetical protein